MIRENVLKLRQCIPGAITIVAVTKGRTVEQIKEVIAAGITDIGENRVQEALIKYNELYAIRSTLYATRWHMVGHLQTNKVKEAVKIFDLIQSVDSLYLAQEIDKEAGKVNKIQDILIEIKTSPEAAKFGIKPDEAIGVIKEIAKLKNINLKGLMTIAPIVDNVENTRPYFKMLRELKDKINTLHILSMGMTDDFQIAIEEGSNMVRLGRAIFEGEK